MDAQEKALAAVIGRNICKYREQAGLTQAKLAEAVGVGNAFISRAERGEKLMKLITLHKIASVLKVSFDSLVYEEDNSKHIHNIQRLLADRPPEFVRGAEEIIRVCVKRFGDKDIER